MRSALSLTLLNDVTKRNTELNEICKFYVTIQFHKGFLLVIYFSMQVETERGGWGARGLEKISIEDRIHTDWCNLLDTISHFDYNAGWLL